MSADTCLIDFHAFIEAVSGFLNLAAGLQIALPINNPLKSAVTDRANCNAYKRLEDLTLGG